MRIRAAELFDADQSCGAEANLTMQTYGVFGFARAYDVERKFRETRLCQIASISTNLILLYIGQHVLDLPRSF